MNSPLHISKTSPKDSIELAVLLGQFSSLSLLSRSLRARASSHARAPTQSQSCCILIATLHSRCDIVFLLRLRSCCLPRPF